MNAYYEWTESIRKSLGLNKTEFAKRLGIPPGTYWSGTSKGYKPSRVNRSRIGRFLGEAKEKKKFQEVWEEVENKFCLACVFACNKEICCFCCKKQKECENRCKNNPKICGCVEVATKGNDE